MKQELLTSILILLLAWPVRQTKPASEVGNGSWCLRPVAAGERENISLEEEPSPAERYVARKVIELFNRWGEAAWDEMRLMGFLPEDLKRIEQLYLVVWPETRPYYKYLAGGHIFYGESSGLFERLRNKCFFRSWNEAGNTLLDAYVYGHFNIAAIEDNEDGYIAIFSYRLFNARVIRGSARIQLAIFSRYFDIKGLFPDEAVKIVVTRRCMRKLRMIAESPLTDEDSLRIRRMVNEKKFIETIGDPESDQRMLRELGIDEALVGPSRESDIIWTLREPGMAELRHRLIDIFGRVAYIPTIGPNEAHAIETSVLRPVASGEKEAPPCPKSDTKQKPKT